MKITNLEMVQSVETEILQSPHLPVEQLGNKLLVEVFIQQQSKLMGLYGLGAAVLLIITDNLE